MENFALAIIFRQLEVSGHLREKASLLSGQQVNSLPHPRHKSANSMHECKYIKYFRKSIPSNRQSSVSLLAVTEEHLSTLLLCRKKIRQSNRRTYVYFVYLPYPVFIWQNDYGGNLSTGAERWAGKAEKAPMGGEKGRLTGRKDCTGEPKRAEWRHETARTAFSKRLFEKVVRAVWHCCRRGSGCQEKSSRWMTDD